MREGEAREQGGSGRQETNQQREGLRGEEVGTEARRQIPYGIM